MRRRTNNATIATDNAPRRSHQRFVREQRREALSDLRQLVAYQMRIPGWNAAARAIVSKMMKEKQETLDALRSNKAINETL